MPDETPFDDRAGKTGNVFTRKYGPLPGWGWGVLSLAAVLFYVKYRQSKTSSAASNAAIGPGTVSSGVVPSSSAYGYTGGLSDQLSNLSGQLSSLQQTLQPQTASASGNAPPTPVIGPDQVSYHIDPSGALIAIYSAGGKLFTDFWGSGFDPNSAPIITDLGNGVYTVQAQMSNGDLATYTKGLPGGIPKEITGPVPLSGASAPSTTSSPAPVQPSMQGGPARGVANQGTSVSGRFV